MSNHVKCDRCPVEITHEHYYLDIIRKDEGGKPGLRGMDLCSNCKESLRRWMKME